MVEVRCGRVFDGFAAAYDARRSGYPRELVASAVEIAGLAADSPVCEVGAGTGKLTELLVAFGLRVDAVEPGANMIEFALRRVGSSELVRFYPVRFEDVDLPEGRYDAVFSASAFHWVDPSVGWAKAASLLRPGGTLALIQPVGVRDYEDGEIVEELEAAFARVAPETAAKRPGLRDEATIHTGVKARAGNVSEAWAWLAHPGHTAAEAANLFGPATLTCVPRKLEQTVDQLWDIFETTAIYHSLSPTARTELRAADTEIIQRRGGTLRTTQLVALLTTQRRS